MKFLKSLNKKNLSGKTCLLRVDFNVEKGKEKNSLRLKAILPTIKFLIDKKTKIVILSHRGRPVKKNRKEFSLKPFARFLSENPAKKINFINNFDFRDIKQKIENSSPLSVFLLENLRFLVGEEKNDAKLAKQLASLGDFYVNDAFSVSHRENASVSAITKFLPSYAGLLLENEIKNLDLVVKNPKRPLIVILGGNKVLDKIGLINNFLNKADYFLLGGGIANTLFAAQGLPVGDSLYEEKMIFVARRILKSKKIILPLDVAIHDRKILDIGPKTAKKYGEIIKKAKIVIWNGPLGYFEDKRFAKGSLAVAEAVAKSGTRAIVGGGETAFLMSKVKGQRSNVFLSTGGGAMLEYLAGKGLPAIEALK